MIKKTTHKGRTLEKLFYEVFADGKYSEFYHALIFTVEGKEVVISSTIDDIRPQLNWLHERGSFHRVDSLEIIGIADIDKLNNFLAALGPTYGQVENRDGKAVLVYR
nr:MAG TPA: hypothetical protein [Bacteriophage sp.]